jgi:hypothetical protein
MQWLYLFIASLFEIGWIFSLKKLSFAEIKKISFVGITQHPTDNLVILLPLLGFFFFGDEANFGFDSFCDLDGRNVGRSKVDRSCFFQGGDQVDGFSIPNIDIGRDYRLKKILISLVSIPIFLIFS